MKYRYEVNGTAATGQTWIATGFVETKLAGEFLKAVSMALAEAFQQLTEGKAVYGNPGVGCSGPYTATKLLIEEQEKAMPTKIDLDNDDNVHVLNVTPEKLRTYFDGSTMEEIFGEDEFTSALDEAQGAVLTDAARVAYVIIKVEK